MTLRFPLVGESNRPIRDAGGALVSITEHAAMFTACANLCAELADCTADTNAGADALLRLRDRARKIMEPTE